MWKLVSNNKKVGVMWPNDADGNAIRAALGPLLDKAGYTIVDPGAYEDGTTDYSSQIAKFKQENCEIFNTFPIPPDFTTFWQQAAQQGYTQMSRSPRSPRPASSHRRSRRRARSATTSRAASTGTRRSRTRRWLAGMTSKQLAAAYTKTTKRQWNQQLGATMALLDAGVTALIRSGNPKSKPAVARALTASTP